jgi:hypothetical protein
MPNWTSNTIRARGPDDAMRAFLEAVRTRDEPFDFNALIPMPELLRHTGKGGMTIDGQKLSNWYVIDPDREHQPRNPNDPANERPFTDAEKAALADIGYADWYDWSCAHWGTKWNACKADVRELCGGELIEITFNTAWAAPIPIFRKLVEMFPAIEFEFSWTDEDEPDVTQTVTIRVGDQP